MNKKKQPIQHGLWRIWGLTINFNSVLTAAFGTLACSGVTWGLFMIHSLYTTAKTMMLDVPKLEGELHRLQTEYPPLTKPTFNAPLQLPAPTASPNG